MSLSWRKRQAIASDQKTWRGLGLDSALWTRIERNATTASAALKPATTSGKTGIVTGLKFIKTEGLDFNNTGELTVYASDASNSSVASTLGINLFDTPHPSTNSGSGLIYTIKKFNSSAVFGNGTPTGTDISGMKYYITSGGSGYNVGDDILLQGTNARGYQQTVSAVTLASGTWTVNGGSAVSQDAYKVFDISCEPGATANAGDTVEIKLAAAPNTVASTGILTANITGTSAQTIRVHAATDQTFDYLAPATNYFLEINGQDATTYGPGTGANGAITEIESNPQVNGFTNTGFNNGSTNLFLLQTLPQREESTAFSAVYSAIRSGSQLVVPAANAGAAGYSNTYGDIGTNTTATIGSSLINGRLTARVTSVANTDPESGRN
jgi:hypothetical protein